MLGMWPWCRGIHCICAMLCVELRHLGVGEHVWSAELGRGCVVTAKVVSFACSPSLD